MHLLLLLLWPQVNEALGRMFGMLETPASLMQPRVLLRFMAYKVLAAAPAPLKTLLASALRPWGIVGLASTAPAPRVGSKEAALAELMGWSTVPAT